MSKFGHKVQVHATEGEILFARGLSVDGHELLVPSGSPIKVSISDERPAEVTFTIFASEVSFDGGAQ